MALLFTHSFDRITAAEVPDRFDTFVSCQLGFGTQINAFRTGNGLRIAPYSGSPGDRPYYRKAFSGRGTYIVGFAFKEDNSSGDRIAPFLKLLDGTTVQLSLQMNNDGTLALLRGDGTQLAASSAAQTLTVGGAKYIELKGTIDPVAGAYTVRVDGTVWFTATGVNTSFGGGSVATDVSIECDTDNLNHAHHFDDLYICDDAGGKNDDFLSAVKLPALPVNGNGNTNGWTPSAGANYECVDDATPDDDATYVYSATLNALDLYTLADLGIAGDVLGVTVNARLRKDEMGPREVAGVVRHATTNEVLSAVVLTDSYVGYQWALDQNPVTAAAWTTSDVNNLEIGAKVTA